MKKALNILKSILVWTAVVIAVFMMIFTIVSVSIFDRNDRNIFGYKTFIVLSDSMAKTHFDAGDLVVLKEVDPATLEEGDIITFVSQNEENFNEVVTHMIKKKTYDESGNPGFVTYGTTTGKEDATIVTYPYIKGQYQFHLPKVGHFFNFLKTPQGYIVCIFIPFMILILYQGLNCIRLFRRYKSEQLQGITAECNQNEAESRASAEMMKELQALKTQLANLKKSEAPGDNDACEQ